MPTALATKREELAAKQQALHVVFEEAKTSDPGVLDLKKVKAIEGDESHKRMEIKRMNDELTAIGQEVELLAAQEYVATIGAKLNDPRSGLPMPVSVVQNQEKSFGELFLETEAFKSAPKGKSDGPETMMDVDAKAMLRAAGMKAVMSTSAGFAPQAIRSGDIVPIATRPIQLLDLIPQLDTSQANVVYMEETTFTNSAAEVAEGSTYAQSTIVYTERTSNVRKIGHYLPVTDEQLEDVPLVAGLVDGQLIFGVRQRLDQQVFNGNGSAPNLTGILNASNLQTQAKGTDPGPDAIFKAIVKVKLVGRADASAVMLHPTDWQNIALLRTAEGVYIWGSPSDPGPRYMWGLPIAQTDAGSAGTAAVGDVLNYCYLAFRRGVNTQVGYVNDDFIKGQKSIRADVRVAFVVRRGAAFCQVTGL
jgi:HK97 family phage major capsid protein